MSSGPTRFRRPALLAVGLALLGIAVNGLPLTVFFDAQLLLGGSLAVFAVLRLGWWGLAVGMSAALVTWHLWGHPWAAVNMILELIWLKVFLDRFNGGPAQRDNGRIVLADLGYWLALGVVLESLLYITLLGADPANAWFLAAKQGINGVINALLGFLLYLLSRLWDLRRETARAGSAWATTGADAIRSAPGLTIRGVASSLVLASILLPAILIIDTLSDRLNKTMLERMRLEMEGFGRAAATLAQGAQEQVLSAFSRSDRPLDFEQRDGDGRGISSNPALFARLATRYGPRLPSPTEIPGLELFVERADRSVLELSLGSYWVYSFILPTQTPGGAEAKIRVVKPAREFVTTMNDQMHASLQLLAVLLLLGVLTSELLGGLLERQFRKVMAPLVSPSRRRPVKTADQVMPDLDHSELRELNALAAIVNARSQQVSQLNRSLRAASQAKSDFLANMSHEIRTPMTGIIGMAQLALASDLDEQQRDYVRKIETSAKSLLGILNDILDLTKVEAGKLQIEKTPFNLPSLIEKVIQIIDITVHEKRLRLVVDMPATLRRCYLGDSLRISQVLINLLSNAVKFTQAGEVRLGVRQPAPGRLAFEVQDTGIGMTPREQERLFQTFSQADTSTTRRYGGTGLGLAISQHLVGLMGGHIAVTSEPGRGSCFSFEIAAETCPTAEACLAEARLEQAPAMPRIVKPKPGELAGRRILLVEDNSINREIVLGFLRDSGLTIEIAEDGQQAVDKCQDDSFDLILMDVQMPVMDGYEATRRIRAMNAKVPIIALTANLFQDDIARSRAAGMSAHLGKPIDSEQLLSTLLTYLTPAPEQGRTQQVVLDTAPQSARSDAVLSSLAGLPRLDVADALELMAGNQRLYAAVLNGFLAEYGRLKLDLGDPDARRILHTLKGLSGNLGAKRLQALATALHRSGDADLLDAFNLELTAVLDAIRELVQTPPENQTETPEKRSGSR